ncbi:hypothetical protein NUW58_g1341 [Xylaria curta]|uniref:Uncharacterized protein n=1 Tax=Xylaria curta TaxID=42375 RepID=A0ACC1PM18_9PEZI|nr:hypothetical protein NUW58_g1341 [Xylaria curta]
MGTLQSSHSDAMVSRKGKFYNAIGFQKGYNFVLWVIFLSLFLGFTLSRLPFLDFHGTMCSAIPKSKFNHAAPGECFYLLQLPCKWGVILHVATILPASILVCLQFVPIIRRKAIALHRVIGRIVIVLSVLSIVGALIVLPRSFGGGLDVQAFGWSLSIAFLWALFMGILSIKRGMIEQHRVWMIRAWFWAGCVITGRVASIIAVKLQRSPLYYAMPCDKINFMLQDRTLALYPHCSSFFTGENKEQNVAVRADFNHPTSIVEVAAALDSSFGMAYFISFLIHIVGVEIYLNLTSGTSQRRRQV